MRTSGANDFSTANNDALKTKETLLANNHAEVINCDHYLGCGSTDQPINTR
jgi:hypothetical protein